jgi:molecular chaperone GrpE
MMGKKKKEEQEKKKEQVNKEVNPAENQETDNNPTDQSTSDQGAQGDQNAKNAELNDKYLRLYSDFDNYRKRTVKERIELSKHASEELITKLLPVLDDFERAIKSLEVIAQADQALKDGTILIFNKLYSILNQQGLQQMRALGEPFDTDFHEAITNIPAPDPEQKGKIVDVLEKGYLLHEKVIRYAKVVVGS